MSVGTALAEARRQAGLSVDDVASMTCIRRTLVENIEADDFHACGGDFYARGHVKSIAHALHLDPAPLLAEFDGEHHNPDLPTASGVLDPEHVQAGAHASQRPGLNWSAVMAVALAALLVLGGYQLVSALGGDDSPSDVVAGSEQPSPSAEPDDQPADEPAAQDSEPTTPDPLSSDAVASAQGDGVTVELSTVGGRSWVSATGKDDGVLLQQVLDDGVSQTLRDDREIALVIGNAGVVRLVVNGEDVGSPGGDGEVVRLRLGPDDGALALG